MGKADRLSGAFWFLFSLFASYESYKLGLGNVYQPGPGFLFFWTGIVIAGLSLAVIIRGSLSPGEGEAKELSFRRSSVLKVVLVVAALFLYGLLVERLGFLIVTLLLFIFLLRVIEKKRWAFAVSIGIAVTVLSYLLFETGLQSQLPKGLLEFLRF